MGHLNVTESDFSDIVAVFQERGIEILHSIHDGEVRIYSHFDEVKDILWAIDALAVAELDVSMPETCEMLEYVA